VSPHRSPADLAAAHRLRQQRLAVLARTQVRRLWRHVDPADAVGSWRMVAGRAGALLGAAQLEAARGADGYVAASLVAGGATPDPVGAVSAAALAGTAADGRDLGGLLGYPAFEVSSFVDRGMAANMALAIGGRHLDRIVMTEVADAARVATGVAVVNDRTARGYVRHLTLPSCGRCVVLAGRWYAVNAGFARHPQCDCVHMPAAEVIEPQSPKALFDAMAQGEQNRAFTRAGAQAIRDGADLARVVNARRGVYTAGGRRYTREATTRRGTGRRLRLTPEQIYIEAHGNRGEAIRLLRLHGYITAR
jgi:hypothetical protein